MTERTDDRHVRRSEIAAASGTRKSLAESLSAKTFRPTAVSADPASGGQRPVGRVRLPNAVRMHVGYGTAARRETAKCVVTGDRGCSGSSKLDLFRVAESEERLGAGISARSRKSARNGDYRHSASGCESQQKSSLDCDEGKVVRSAISVERRGLRDDADERQGRRIGAGVVGYVRNLDTRRKF
jgi:hypothetical protein